MILEWLRHCRSIYGANDRKEPMKEGICVDAPPPTALKHRYYVAGECVGYFEKRKEWLFIGVRDGTLGGIYFQKPLAEKHVSEIAEHLKFLNEKER